MIEMYKLLKPAKSERFEIKYKKASASDVKAVKFRDLVQGRYEYEGFKEGTYVQLYDNKKHEIVMSDTPMEFNTNNHFIQNANGDVLIAGLGLGLVVLAIQDNPKIKSITIVEKYKEIIDLITKQITFNPKVEIINADIFEYKPNKDKFDVIYFDIWNNVCGDHYMKMKKLHRKFCRKVNRENKNSFIDSWRKEDCKRLDKIW